MDISFRKAPDGKRLSSKIRQQIVEFVNCLEGEDSFYLCQQSIKSATTEGQRTALAGNWEASESIDLSYFLEYTLASLAQDDPDGTHSLCLVTDRLGKEGFNSLSSINTIREKAGLECRFLVIGIGKGYDLGTVSAFCLNEGIEFRHVDDPDRLSEVMTNWAKEKNV